MIVPRYYENLNVLHENTQPARAYYVPASCRMDDLVEHREGSDRLQLLNGKWKFQYFKSIYDVKDAFYEMGYDTGAFDEIDMIHTSIQISAIHFHLTHHMSHRIYRVELMCIPFLMQRMWMRQRHF